jgi:membrane protease YdiL (CAAX protease family)
MRALFFNDENPVGQLSITILTCLCCLFIFSFLGSVIAFFFYHVHPRDLQMELENLNNIPLQKFFQGVQGVGLFLVPALIVGRLFSGRSFDYLKMNVLPSTYKFFLVIVVVASSVPVIDLLSKLSSMIRLPDSMAGVQNYIDQTSKLYQTISESFMKGSSIPGLLLNLLIVAVIPALGEEFLFRGVFQRIFTNWTRNPHWGIFISAFFFSLIHMEFYGFVQRLLLGMMFGYFLLWSGSIWLPVLAHFINNVVAVVLFYLISNGFINAKMAETGSLSDALPITIISFAVMGTGIYVLFKKKLEV